MENIQHGDSASPANPPRQQKSGNTDEQTIALTKARLAIDEVDARIVELLKNRAEWVHEVGRIKKEGNSPIFVPERETALLSKLNRLNAGVLPEASLQAIYREIISCSFFLEGGLTIAYLGPKGTWSHQAALKQFGKSCELIPCQSFKDVFDMVDRGKAQYGVVPVENSSEGSVTAVMDLFVTSPLKICAQINLNIRNSLMADIPRVRILIPGRKHLDVGRKLYWDLFSQSISMGLMSSIVSAGSVILQYGINGLGTLTIAGHTAARKLFAFTSMPLIAMANAASTFVSQNYGAGQPERIRKGMREIYLYSLVVMVVTVLLMQVSAEWLVRMVSGSSEALVLENGARYLRWTSPFYAVLGVLLSTRYALQSLGEKVLPLFSSVIEFLGKVVFVLVFIPRFAYNAVILCEPVVWCFMALYLVAVYRCNPFVFPKKQ